MKITNLFINPQTQLLRSGWRAFVFCAIVFMPRLALLLASPNQAVGKSEPSFAPDWAMIIVYCALIVWVTLVSWLCLHWLERLPLASLGYPFYRGWWRAVLAGCAIGAAMIVIVVSLQFLGGGTRVNVNQVWAQEPAALMGSFCLASLLLIVAAAFEEIVFRGYAFQTLLRDVPAWVPIILFSLLFGLAHWSNPSRTFFSTINTTLAGIWLTVAFMKTYSLWFATALHLSWNWMMGLFFGLPVSGMLLRPSLLIASSDAPVWLTGGSYGCEGGIATTLVFVLSTIWIWRAKWLEIAPEMKLAWTRKKPQATETLQFRLNEKTN